MEISIIIPVYNSEKYLKECIDSALNQDFKLDYEVLVAYDESNDKTLDILKEYETKDNRLKIIYCSNYGLALKRLYAIRKSSGKYICFLDSDDLYARNYLSTLYNEIEKGYDIVNCSFFNLRKGKATKDLFKKNKEYDSINACKALLKDTSMRSFLWNKIFKREFFFSDKLVLPKCKKPIFEDSMMLYGIFMEAKRIKSIKIPLYYYRYNELSATKKENKDRFNYHLYTFFMMRYLSEQSSNPKYLKVFLSKWFRCKLSLYFDAYVTRHALNHGVLKEMSLHKEEFKMIKSKKKLDINSLPLKDYLIDSLKNSDNYF